MVAKLKLTPKWSQKYIGLNWSQFFHEIRIGRKLLHGFELIANKSYGFKLVANKPCGFKLVAKISHHGFQLVANISIGSNWSQMIWMGSDWSQIYLTMGSNWSQIFPWIKIIVICCMGRHRHNHPYEHKALANKHKRCRRARPPSRVR